MPSLAGGLVLYYVVSCPNHVHYQMRNSLVYQVETFRFYSWMHVGRTNVIAGSLLLYSTSITFA